MFKRIKSQRGATLVGVLIAMVVAGIGLYALIQTQGEMTSGISASKARAEALQVAQKTFESQRAYIHSDQFDTDLATQTWGACNSVSDFTGVNADFIVECRIADATDGNYKQAMVRVRWTDEASNPQSVSLNKFILFKDPSLMASIKQEEDGTSSRGTLTRRGRWGDEKAEEGTTHVSGSETALHGTAETDGFSEIVNLGLNSNGNWEIYLGDGNGIGGNTVLTSFGGIIHKIEGRIYFKDSGFAKEEIAVLGTSPAYCVFPICDGLDCGIEADYACYVPGDCSNEVNGLGSFVEKTGINDACKGGITDSTELSAHLAKIKGLELDGGWYGRIGILLLGNVAQGKIPKACLKDLILNVPDDPSDSNYKSIADLDIVSPLPPIFSNDTPARYYAARQILDDPTDPSEKIVVQFEGINTPFACQDILFTDVGGKIKTCQQAAESAGIPINKFTGGDPSSPYFEFDDKLRNLVANENTWDPPIPNEIRGLEIYGVNSNGASLYPDVACHNRQVRFPTTTPIPPDPTP